MTRSAFGGKKTKGKANPKTTAELLKKNLDK